MAAENPFDSIDPYVGIAEDKEKWQAAQDALGAAGLLDTPQGQPPSSLPKKPRRRGGDWIKAAKGVAQQRSLSPLLSELHVNPMAADWYRAMTSGASGPEARDAALKAARTRMAKDMLIG